MTPLNGGAGEEACVWAARASLAFLTVAVLPLRTIVVLPLKTSPPLAAVVSSSLFCVGKPIVPPSIPSLPVVVLNTGGPAPQLPLLNHPVPDDVLTSTRSFGLWLVRPNDGAPQTAMLSSFVCIGPLSPSPVRKEIVEHADGRADRGLLHVAIVEVVDVSASGSSVS